MIVIDVNVLLAAFIVQHPLHHAAVRFVADSLKEGGVAVPDVVWSGFARIASNPATSTPPVEWSRIRAFADTIRRHPGYRADVRAMTSPVESFLASCHAMGARGNKVADAYIAAVATDHNAAVATWDADFDTLPVPVITPALDD
ncbi:MAG: PIN domain-containing protein [Actinomycetia bacterium]|nr:PIN domain-containing protein [Actinomycetes bacterium]